MHNSLDLSFTTLIASSTHDIKNILSSALEGLDWLYDRSGPLNSSQHDELEKIIQMLSNVNSELMQLLYFYKFESKQYNLNMHEIYIDDFVKMQQAFFQSMVKSGKFELIVKYDVNLAWYFDDVLVTSAIRNAIMNSLKFAKKKIMLEIIKVDQSLLQINVEDDGNGYPENMLGKIEVMQKKTVSPTDKNSTGLGLMFASQVASVHKSRKSGLKGYMELSKSTELGGAKFSFFIP